MTSTENVITYDSGSRRNTFFASSPSPLSNSNVSVVADEVASTIAGAFDLKSAEFSRAVTTSSLTRSVNGRGVVGGSPDGTMSMGLPALSR